MKRKRLPKTQREALVKLGERGALDKATGLSVFDGIPQNTAGALIRHCMVDKAVRRRHGSQRTVYWLTPKGVAEFERERSLLDFRGGTDAQT